MCSLPVSLFLISSLSWLSFPLFLDLKLSSSPPSRGSLLSYRAYVWFLFSSPAKLFDALSSPSVSCAVCVIVSFALCFFSLDIKLTSSPPSRYILLSYRAYLWFSSRASLFDVLYFHDWHGAGFFTALAKHQGHLMKRSKADVHTQSNNREPIIISVLHCPSLFFLHGLL